MVGPRARNKAKGQSESGGKLLVLTFHGIQFQKEKQSLETYHFRIFLIFYGGPAIVITKNCMWTHF